MNKSRIARVSAVGMVVLLSAAVVAPEKPGVRQVEIIGDDYAFIGPRELAPGPAVFRFTNRGKVRHEFNISLLKAGVTPEQFMAALWEGKPVSPMRDGSVGVLFAKAGRRTGAGLETDLKPGRDYMIICIFRDSAGAKRHHELGMYSVIHVAGGASPRPVTQRVDTIIGTDYAFQYDRVLRPGPHTFEFVNRGKQRHEVTFALLRRGVTVQQVMDADKAGKKVGPLLEERPGLLHSLGGEPALGRLKLDLAAGREYMIECSFKDTDSAPPHYEMGMYGSIKVSRK